MRPPALASLLAAALLLAGGRDGLAEPDPLQADEQTLKEAKLATDTPALVQFFRDRTPSDEQRNKVRDLIRQLGSDEFAAREKASAALAQAGPPALPQLRDALKDPDPEVRRRAGRCVQIIEDGRNSGVTAAAARLLAARKPPEAAAALLAYLPGAEDDHVAREVRAALSSLAMRDGKPEPAFVQALTDKNAVKRAAAGEALGRVGAVRDSVRKLLKDPDATVRLRVGLALLAAKEKDAVPALVGVLGDLPVSSAWEAEDALRALAGEKAPSVPLGEDEAGRKKCRDAWAAWWKDNEAKIDLAKVPGLRASLGLLLAVVADNTGFCNLIEYGPGGKERWHIPRLSNSVDVHALPGSRVLVAEYGASRVVEFNTRGEVLWEKKIPSPFQAQRLPNGHTFIATSGRVVEVDRQGKEVLAINIKCRAAWRYPNGQISVMGTDQRWRRYDARGRELSSVQVRFTRGNTIGGVEFLPGNRVLIADGNTLKEYDANGKKLWEAAVQDPDCTQRLPNGNTLVACMGTSRIVELDRAGKVVWEMKVDGRPWLARRR